MDGIPPGGSPNPCVARDSSLACVACTQCAGSVGLQHPDTLESCAPPRRCLVVLLLLLVQPRQTRLRGLGMLQPDAAPPRRRCPAAAATAWQGSLRDCLDAEGPNVRAASGSITPISKLHRT